MSIKIYTGYRLKSIEMHKLKKFLDNVREEFTIIRKNYIKENYEKEDYFKNVFLPISKGDLMLSAKISFFPTKNYIYCVTSFYHIYKEFWESLKEVDFYGYWDNTDRLEGVSAKEWRTRKNVWDKVWPDFASPSINSFTYNFFSDVLPLANEIYASNDLIEKVI